MRHEGPAIVLLLSMGTVFVGAAGCNGDRRAAPPALAGETVATGSGTGAPILASDTVSGCVSGAALVKVLVDLKLEKDRCVPEVTPASVCVAAGGVVRFKVQNGCSALGDPSRPALEISQPVFKRRLTAARDETKQSPLFQNCVLRVPKIDRGSNQVLLCDVDPEAYEGFYKYGLTGQIEALDPDVEVRPGRR